MVETTALGAAILAGVGIGIIDINEVDASQVTKFTPAIGEDGNVLLYDAYYETNNINSYYTFMFQNEI